MVGDAAAAGARVVCGGTRSTAPGCKRGFYVTPCVLADVTDDMAIASEAFGEEEMGSM